MLLSDKHLYYSYREKRVCRPVLSPILRTLFNPWELSNDPFGIVVTGSSMTLKYQVDLFMSHHRKESEDMAALLLIKGWDTLKDVERYACRFQQITPDLAMRLYRRFQGRYRPLVTALSEILREPSCDSDNIIQRHWDEIVEDEGGSSLRRSF